MLLALFSGPTARVDALIAAFAAAGLPAAVDRTDGQPNTRFHALERPGWPEMLVAALAVGGSAIPVPADQAVVDEAGEPVWDETADELEIEVLCDDVDVAVDIAGPHGFRLRMHGPSGFSTLRQAEAVLAARLLPGKHPLLADLETNPQLLAAVRALLVEAQP